MPALRLGCRDTRKGGQLPTRDWDQCLLCGLVAETDVESNHTERRASEQCLLCGLVIDLYGPNQLAAKAARGRIDG